MSVGWYVAPSAQILRVAIERATSPAGPWQQVGELTSGLGEGAHSFADRSLDEPGTYLYRLRTQLAGGEEKIFGPAGVKVAEPQLAIVAERNPARGSARLFYTVPRAGRVALEIFDSQGRRVRSAVSASEHMGRSSWTWDGRSESGQRMSGGLYYARIVAAGRARTFKLTLLP